MNGWRYDALPVPGRAVRGDRARVAWVGLRGANVTIPHKLLALGVADEASEAARGAGAANTLTFRPDGSVRADNTDTGGLMDALGEAPSQRARPRRGRRRARCGLGAAPGGRARDDLEPHGRAGRRPGGRTGRRSRRRSRPGRVRRRSQLDVDRPGHAAVRRERPGRTRPRGKVPRRTVVDMVYRSGGAPTPLQTWARERIGPVHRRSGGTRTPGSAQLRDLDRAETGPGRDARRRQEPEPLQRQRTKPKRRPADSTPAWQSLARSSSQSSASPCA